MYKENKNVLNYLQDYLADAESDMSIKRHGSNESMTHSITSVDSNNIQGSVPGTPTPQHIQPEEYYE